MNYQEKIYNTVKSFIETMADLDGKEREINKQVQAKTLARVTADQQRAALKVQRDAAYTGTVQEIERIRVSHAEAGRDRQVLSEHRQKPPDRKIER